MFSLHKTVGGKWDRSPAFLCLCLCLFLLTGMSVNVQAATGGFLAHEAEPQTGDLYAGHLLKKEYAQSRISHIGDDSDHTWITLEGNITGIHQDNTYQFRDPTGQIALSISSDAWNGHKVDAREVVRVSGFLTHRSGVQLLEVDEVNLP